ncbi:MAG: hypothetical protein FWB78_09670, partial [Treponema sp.]|nr:hypothetical protein [Treponema sp.]
MGVRRTNVRGNTSSRRRPVRRALRRGRRRMAVSALLLVLVMVVIAVALLAILPRAWENASPSPAVVQPPTNMAQFQQSERPIDVTPIPREEPPMELIPPEDLIVQPPAQPPTQPPATSPVERPADTRERGIFLIQMENEGADL